MFYYFSKKYSKLIEKLLLIFSDELFNFRNFPCSSQWVTEQIDWRMGVEIRDSVIGFFGFGGIGQAIAKRLQSWDVAKMLYTTRTRKENDVEFQAEHVPFERLLRESDFLVVAAPLTDETRGKFNAQAFGQMKRNAVFLNVARGGKWAYMQGGGSANKVFTISSIAGLVNQADLHEALSTGQILAAGLDVTTPEPLPADSPILKLPNCGSY